MAKKRPPFIILEGLDGCGKSTQAEALCVHLASCGHEVEHLREPGSTPLGEQVRELLLTQKQGLKIDAMAELLLYMASRAQLVDERIRPAREASRAVIMERGYYSSVAYQGHGLGLSIPLITSLGETLMAEHLPDRVVFLDLPIESALSRLRGGRDRIESRDLEFFSRVRDGYLAQARACEERFLIVSAEGDPEEIQHAVREGLRDVL